MADDKAAADASAPEKKSKLGMIIGILIAIITLIGGSVAGAILGPQLMGAPAASAEEEDEEEGGGESEAVDSSEKAAANKPKAPDAPPGAPKEIISVALPPVIVDLRDEDGRTRHLKVGLSAELMDETMTEEFPLVIPRGREAALGYLRSLTFEEIADPKKYNEIKETLSTRVIEALGKHRVYRILLTEFVAQ